jgi:hypothetical protein
MIATRSDSKCTTPSHILGLSLNRGLFGMLEEMRKTITALLSKLYLPDHVETPALQAMVVLIRNIASVRLLDPSKGGNR